METSCASSRKNGRPPKWSPCRWVIKILLTSRGSIRCWRKAISDALRRGQKAARVRAEIVPEDEAAFLVAVLAGAGATGKVGQEFSLFQNCFRVAERHLLTLLP